MITGLISQGTGEGGPDQHFIKVQGSIYRNKIKNTLKKFERLYWLVCAVIKRPYRRLAVQTRFCPRFLSTFPSMYSPFIKLREWGYFVIRNSAHLHNVRYLLCGSGIRNWIWIIFSRVRCMKLSLPVLTSLKPLRSGRSDFIPRTLKDFEVVVA